MTRMFVCDGFLFAEDGKKFVMRASTLCQAMRCSASALSGLPNIGACEVSVSKGTEPSVCLLRHLMGTCIGT